MANLRGPFKLSVSSRKGDTLSVSIDGNLFYDVPDGEPDDSWLFVTPNSGDYTDGFYLVSSNYHLAVDYKPERGEGLHASPLTFQSVHTIWHTTSDSEIFTIDHEGEKKYLWTILNSIYVTPDEHLAERWSAISLEGYDVGLTQRKDKSADNNPQFIILTCIFLLVSLLYLYIPY